MGSDSFSFLINNGAEVNKMQLVLPEHTPSGSRSFSGTALHSACEWGFEDSEVFLLDHGADSGLKNSKGQSIEELKKLQVRRAGR